ncbi:aldehyde dehydrogenase family protein [Bradyrhizobium cajani]|uniref:Aldehyde dehydrogenase family protein n=1 Tax=Bradyrhizobium cajani TaxID=1928661 RepID=A0A844T6M3_9BRAD|nr:aldehyde dehydrogenase family protein [Bradyrhizobium cajani]MCP3369284.1 aldehyde dehydrogenase family protein [Bradyrhizobium cajani]MVT74587.1 aldehyde dehydrogenase family protein [Bradyrhizobium cajani]
MDQTLDKSPTSAPLQALEAAFQAMVARSRAEPAPDLAERLTRLRAVVADNEERFRQAISADFGHRSAVETTIAETMLVLSEIRPATKHLKSWMAPQRIATALQFLPARNRLIPQPLGVVGIIAPWNYPLQLTLAPAIGAIAAGNRVIIKPRELAPHFSGKDRSARDEVLSRTISGGVTVNDCLFHFTQINQPMGDVGASGTGAYHGEWGFKTFSKLKPVFYRSKFNRLADLYPPYGGKIARLEKLMRFMS